MNRCWLLFLLIACGCGNRRGFCPADGARGGVCGGKDCGSLKERDDCGCKKNHRDDDCGCKKEHREDDCGSKKNHRDDDCGCKKEHRDDDCGCGKDDWKHGPMTDRSRDDGEDCGCGGINPPPIRRDF